PNDDIYGLGNVTACLSGGYYPPLPRYDTQTGEEISPGGFARTVPDQETLRPVHRADIIRPC
ncbi:MAG: hypothetical protein AAGU05_11990, partial [Anaerolineaceae bacterium]